MREENIDLEIINELLGKDRFLRLNLQFCKLLGIESAVVLTHILDAITFELYGNPNANQQGVKIYRSKLTDLYGLSIHKQQKAEKVLVEQGIISIKLIYNKETKQSYNFYKIDLSVLAEKLGKI